MPRQQLSCRPRPEIDDSRSSTRAIGSARARSCYSPATGETRVNTEIHLLVKLARITVFAFSHRSEATWRAERLMSLNSETMEHGETLHVEGAAMPQGFRVIQRSGQRPALCRLIIRGSPPEGMRPPANAPVICLRRAAGSGNDGRLPSFVTGVALSDLPSGSRFCAPLRLGFCRTLDPDRLAAWYPHYYLSCPRTSRCRGYHTSDSTFNLGSPV